jgi:hypothetical protein
MRVVLAGSVIRITSYDPSVRCSNWGAQMSLASSQRTVSSGLPLQKSYDVRILVAAAIVAAGIVVAIGALAAHHGISPGDIGLMAAFP